MLTCGFHGDLSGFHGDLSGFHGDLSAVLCCFLSSVFLLPSSSRFTSGMTPPDLDCFEKKRDLSIGVKQKM